MKETRELGVFYSCICPCLKEVVAGKKEKNLDKFITFFP